MDDLKVLSNEEQTYLLMCGYLSQLPDETQLKVAAARAEIKGTLNLYGEAGVVALGLVGAEMAAKGELEP